MNTTFSLTLSVTVWMMAGQELWVCGNLGWAWSGRFYYNRTSISGGFDCGWNAVIWLSWWWYPPVTLTPSSPRRDQASPPLSVNYYWCSYPDSLGQCSLTFLAPETGFMEDGGGGRWSSDELPQGLVPNRPWSSSSLRPEVWGPLLQGVPSTGHSMLCWDLLFVKRSETELWAEWRI